MENKIGLVGYHGTSDDEEKEAKPYKRPGTSVDTPHVKPQVFLSEDDPYFNGNPKNENGDEIIPVEDKYQTSREKLDKSYRPKPKKVN